MNTKLIRNLQSWVATQDITVLHFGATVVGAVVVCGILFYGILG